jgi:aminoglycoside phosphotransferase (APT) family kinase protein
MWRMQLPEFAPVSDEALAAVARRYGAAEVTPLPVVGIFNALFALDDALVLRIPRDHPAFLSALAKEPLAVPLARAAGVRTPALVDSDASRTLIPVPYTVYERVRGDTFGLRPGDPVGSPRVWQELGADLARLHLGVGPGSAVAGLACEDLPDGTQLARQLAERGSVGPAEADWLCDWLARLEERAGPRPSVFVHGDIQTTNVMLVDGSYAALLDWGACGWADPATDFAGIPLRAVPALLSGYADRGGPVDDGLRTAIVRRHLLIALFLAHRAAQPGRSWAERPLGVLLDLLRFLAAAPHGWGHTAPPR